MRDHSSTDRAATERQQFDRRQFLGVGAGVGMALLAGCTGQSSSDTGSDDGTTGSETTGSFRLLISDQPTDIGDFDSLNVSCDIARVFKGGDDEEDDQEANESETEEQEEPENETNETETEDDEPRDDTADDDEDDGQRGDDDADDDEDDEEGDFSIIDLDGATVDLTEVVGKKAIGVFDGKLEAGQYSKIELYASSVDGVVDGESVDVTIPSGKLQIVKPFEITDDEPVSFVFDINVVKKGNQAAYNLLPVISESGVAGKDVDVEEVEDREDDGDEDEEADDDDDEANSTAAGDDTNSSAESGNETADADQ